METKGTTRTGFAYEISEAALNNYALLEAISEVEDNPFKIPKVVKLLLGENQAKKLVEHIKVDGIAPLDKMEAELLDIFNGCNELKK